MWDKEEEREGVSWYLKRARQFLGGGGGGGVYSGSYTREAPFLTRWDQHKGGGGGGVD